MTQSIVSTDKKPKTALCASKIKIAKQLRVMQNAWWDRKADEQLADENSSKGFFAAIKHVWSTENCCQLEMRKVHKPMQSRKT